MNPSYLHAKGRFPLHLALWEVARPLAKNVRDSFSRSDGAWRRERLRGNAIAALDVLRRRFTPERVLDL